MNADTRCIATPARLRWAMLRTNWPPEKQGIWLARSQDSYGISIDDARKLAHDAGVSLAALYLPDPSRWEMVKAWLHGVLA